jgi:hypothetical protein
MNPRARQDELIVEDLPDEIVIYDRQRHKVHRLNRTAGLVWRHSDGRTSVGELARMLHAELDLPVDESLVWMALSRLARARLLCEPVPRPIEEVSISRREVLRRLGLAGALLLPVVTSVTALTPAMAQLPPCKDQIVNQVLVGESRCFTAAERLDPNWLVEADFEAEQNLRNRIDLRCFELCEGECPPQRFCFRTGHRIRPIPGARGAGIIFQTVDCATAGERKRTATGARFRCICTCLRVT